MSASCLWDIAGSLDVQISYFFERIDDETVASGNGAVPSDLMGDKEALGLVHCYCAIPENQRRKLFELARALAEVA